MKPLQKLITLMLLRLKILLTNQEPLIFCSNSTTRWKYRNDQTASKTHLFFIIWIRKCHIFIFVCFFLFFSCFKIGRLYRNRSEMKIHTAASGGHRSIEKKKSKETKASSSRPKSHSIIDFL